jgi:hypothetical protein
VRIAFALALPVIAGVVAAACGYLASTCKADGDCAGTSTRCVGGECVAAAGEGEQDAGARGEEGEGEGEGEGEVDAGRASDAGPSDAGSSASDGGASDAGSNDAGASDAGSGAGDAGPSDAGPSDAGSRDAGFVDAGPTIVTACPPDQTGVFDLQPGSSTTPFTVFCLAKPSDFSSSFAALDSAGAGGFALALKLSASDSASGRFGRDDDASWNASARFGDPTTKSTAASARSEAYSQVALHEVLLVLDYGGADLRAVRFALPTPASSLLAQVQSKSPQLGRLSQSTWLAFSKITGHVFTTNSDIFSDGINPQVNAGFPVVRIGAFAAVPSAVSPDEQVGMGLAACGSAIGAGSWRADELLSSCDVEHHPAAALVFVR